MKQQTPSLSQNGFSLIEIIIAVGIMGVVALGFATMMADQAKQLKGLSQKLATVELESQMKQTMLNNSYCGCLLRDKTFDTTTLQFSSLPTAMPDGWQQPVPATGPCTSVGTNLIEVGAVNPSTHIKIDGLKIEDITSTGTGSYKGRLVATLDQSTLVRAFKPVGAPFSFNVDPTIPTAATFISCGEYNPVAAEVVRSAAWLDNYNYVDCPPGKTMVSCSISTNTGDGSSNFYRNKIQFSPPTDKPTRCFMNQHDGSDTFQVVGICI